MASLDLRLVAPKDDLADRLGGHTIYLGELSYFTSLK